MVHLISQEYRFRHRIFAFIVVVDRVTLWSKDKFDTREVILKVIENHRLNLVLYLLLFRRVPRSIHRLFHRTCETTLTRVELATNYAILGERTADLLAYINKSAKKLPGQFRKGCRLTDLSDVAIWIELFANGTLGRDRARVGRVGVFLSTCRLRGVEDGVVGRHFALL